MKMLLIFAALAGLAYLGFKYITQGAPHARLSTIVTVPGATISKLTFNGGSVGMIILVIGVAFLVLIIAYTLISK